MRSGHIGRWAAVAGALLLSGACAQTPGLAGVSAQSPVTAPVSPTGTPQVTATIPDPSRSPAAALQAPEGDAPVQVPPPKLSKYTYAFPVKGCKTTYQRRLIMLPKTTIWAATGCAFVAPIGGVVDEVNIKNRWRPSTDKGADREGRFVTIIGDDGVHYLGGHLDSVAEGVKPGLRVKKGQLLGRVGTSGNARDTGPNLYFAISWKTGPAYWWVRRGMVDSWDYLAAWQSGNRTYSPREETLELRGKLGETPQCSVQCTSKKQTSKPTRPPQLEPDDQGPVISDPTTVPFGQ
ncbi:peptidoglycan DD-metalloendopeptidase family protein [Nonomuraea sp. NN258]|uniref:M23 family metallopeptidase n=1 Tax=Nonomuraea antri TaxID=2730852 RepID=UPI0015697ADF|nr:M23 family metallopeptidase [Nonomuraea antri]NRQ38731.1 peptidoglycan DD-metalloendopeptidase family protein [Nonomuraea antri]